MLLNIAKGKVTEIDYLNGWIVKEGKLHNIPCPTHESIIAQVKEKAREQALKLEAEKEALREARRAQRSEESRKASNDSQTGKKSEWRGEPDLDKLQIKRMKKAQRQRDLLGNNPYQLIMPGPKFRLLEACRSAQSRMRSMKMELMRKSSF
jgi:uncharacterized Zn finger protein (UPF0148 family)